MTVDVISGTPPTALPALQGGFLEKFDWAGVFGSEFPTIREPLERVIIPEFKDILVLNWDSVLAVGYNKESIQPDQVPDTLEAMTDPRYRGKFTMDPGGGGLDTLSHRLGREKIIDLATRLSQNGPIIIRGAPAATEAIQTGRVAFGANAIINEIERLKADQQPVDWKPLADGIVVQESSIYTFKGSPHPNLARLFIAYTTTEGQRIMEKWEWIGRASDEASVVGKELKRLGVGMDRLVRAKSLDDLRAETQIREELTRIIGSGS
jgi:iron(III) transport system substrate-binding protein